MSVNSLDHGLRVCVRGAQRWSVIIGALSIENSQRRQQQQLMQSVEMRQAPSDLSQTSVTSQPDNDDTAAGTFSVVVDVVVVVSSFLRWLSSSPL